MAEPATITAEKLCALTGLTDRRHRQLAGEGYFPPPIKGVYQLTPTISGMFRYYREANQRITRSLAEDKSLKTKREIELLELKIAQQQKRLAPIERVQAVWDSSCAGIRQAIIAANISEQARDEIFGNIRKIEPEDYLSPEDCEGVSSDD